MQANGFVLSLTLAYMAAMGLISVSAQRYAKSAGSFTSGGTRYPAVLIGFLLMSEFVGTAASVGTTQTAFKVGLSAAWNIATLGVGFRLYAVFLAGRFKELGENTISGALARAYGHPALGPLPRRAFEDGVTTRAASEWPSAEVIEERAPHRRSLPPAARL